MWPFCLYIYKMTMAKAAILKSLAFKWLGLEHGSPFVRILNGLNHLITDF